MLSLSITMLMDFGTEEEILFDLKDIKVLVGCAIALGNAFLRRCVARTEATSIFISKLLT